MKFGQLIFATAFMGVATLVSATIPHDTTVQTEGPKPLHSHIPTSRGTTRRYLGGQQHRPVSPVTRPSLAKKISPGSRRDGINLRTRDINHGNLYTRAPLNIKGLVSVVKSSGLATKVTSGYRDAKAAGGTRNVKVAGKALVKGAGGGKALASALGNTWALYRQTQGEGVYPQYRRSIEGVPEDAMDPRDLDTSGYGSRHSFEPGKHNEG
ncbi:hypothetical protein BDZ94DRAFT_1246797 [Collybia nuda]|uniref:Uncharacterized protein n=1 Tax=Collybia nuda TaxID=64659 RepID=A0A9P5YFR2_9AGAR|nr:hypothetical protein BDZ94DRAFT_1246797 [Collybia nuda]